MHHLGTPGGGNWFVQIRKMTHEPPISTPTDGSEWGWVPPIKLPHWMGWETPPYTTSRMGCGTLPKKSKFSGKFPEKKYQN